LNIYIAPLHDIYSEVIFALAYSFIHSAISIAPLHVLYYSEALLTTARILYRLKAIESTKAPPCPTISLCC